MVAVCAAIAAAVVAVPASPAYDVWAWLVWGREVGHLDLATVGGPSWKPLPVLVTSVLALAGDAAPTLWLLVSRTAGLLAVVGVYRLGAGSPAPWPGSPPPLFLVLTPDAEVRFLRVVLEGHTAALTAALAVWAIECHLAGRRRLALFLLFLLALDRPEAWPFLAVYAWWSWREDRDRRWYPVACSGSCRCCGSVATGGVRAAPGTAPTPPRVVASDGHRFLDALERGRRHGAVDRVARGGVRGRARAHPAPRPRGARARGLAAVWAVLVSR